MELLKFTRIPEGRLEDIGALRAACRSAGECGRLELELSLNACPDLPCLFLAYEAAELAGAATLFAPSPREAELSAIVRPDRRKKGIFTELRTEAAAELGAHGWTELLFVADAACPAAARIVPGLGATLERSELHMVREGGALPSGPSRRGREEHDWLRVERVGPERLQQLAGLARGEFGDRREEAEAFIAASLAQPSRLVYAAFRGDEMLASCSIGIEDGGSFLSGVVVAPSERGRGLGRAFIARALREAGAEGRPCSLDVDSANEPARRLYSGLGFEARSRADYYRARL